jgi:hypothetical protein
MMRLIYIDRQNIKNGRNAVRNVSNGRPVMDMLAIIETTEVNDDCISS